MFDQKCEYAATKHFSDPNAFIECSDTMDDVYENIDNYNSSRPRKILIVFDDMISGFMSNKNFKALLKNCLLGAEN